MALWADACFLDQSVFFGPILANLLCEAAGELQVKRKNQALEWMWSLVEEGLKDRFHRHPAIRRQLERTVARVRQGDVGPATAARELLFLLDNPLTAYEKC